jgi:hypothetical protein
LNPRGDGHDTAIEVETLPKVFECREGSQVDALELVARRQVVGRRCRPSGALEQLRGYSVDVSNAGARTSARVPQSRGLAATSAAAARINGSSPPRWPWSSFLRVVAEFASTYEDGNPRRRTHRFWSARSEARAVTLQELELGRRRSSSKERVTVGKAPERLDHLAMPPRVVES